MKSPKKPSKETPLPSQDEARRANVLMEQMLSKFDTFGEVQSAMCERLDRMEPDLHAVKEDVAVLKAVARTHTDAIKTNTETIKTNTEAINMNTEEIRSLKGIVQGHTEAIHSMQTDLKNINQRLEVVESKS